ncbi:MAG: oligosaccharide flippase family protein [Gemmatimonadota bacterium]|nr:oligosaccharide flippase family protein [Gemmatimonadota bacterium]
MSAGGAEAAPFFRPTDGQRKEEAKLGAQGSWRDAIHAGSANVYAALVSAGILAVTARLLGPTGRGVYAAATSWASVFATIASLSLGQAAIHQTAGRPHGEWAAEVAGTLRGLVLVISSIAWSVAVLLYVETRGRFFQHIPATALCIAFAALPFSLWFDNGRYLLFAMERVPAFNRSQYVGYTVSGLATVVLLRGFHLGVGGALVAWMLLYATMAIVGYAAVHSGGLSSRFSSARAGRLLSASATLHWTTIGTFIQLQSSVLILNQFRSSQEVAFYQLAIQVTALGTLLPLGVSSIAYSMVARVGPDAAWTRQRGLLVGTIAAAVVTAVVGYPLAPIGIRLIAGTAFLPAVPLVRILLVSLVGMSMSLVMASQWVGRGLFRQMAALAIGIAVLSLVLDFSLIPRYGMYGALVSTLAVYTVAFIANGALALWVERRTRTVNR